MTVHSHTHTHVRLSVVASHTRTYTIFCTYIYIAMFFKQDSLLLHFQSKFYLSLFVPYGIINLSIVVCGVFCRYEIISRLE